MDRLSPGTEYRSDIEGLRAIAVAMVLLYHAQLAVLPGGYAGVDVFFVLSGYLITRSMLTELSTSGRVRLGSFYARRARRLLPAAALVLLVTTAGVRWLLPMTMWQDYGRDIVASAAYVMNWRLASRSVDYLAEDVLASPAQHFWSLAVEEQYYLLWPVLILVVAVLATWRGWSRERAIAVALVAVVIVPSAVWSLVLTGREPARAFFDTGTRLWELGAGALAATAAPALATWGHPRLRAAVRVVALLVVVAMAFLVDQSSPWPGALAAGVVVPTTVLVLVRGGEGDPVDRLLSRWSFQRVGEMSYSLYLWHWPPLAILAARWDGLTTVQATSITLIAVVPAWLSYRFVENPFRHGAWLRRSSGRSLGVGAGLSLAGIALGIGLVAAVPAVTPSGQDLGPRAAASAEQFGAAVFARAPGGDDDMEASTITPSPVHAREDRPRTYADDCHVRFSDADPVLCSYGSTEADVHVAIVGDSKAGQWADAVLDIAERRNWRVTNITKSSCALATTLQELDGRAFTTCLEWNQQVLEILRDAPPDLVITSQGTERAFDETEPEALVRGMLDAWSQIEAVGSRLLVITDNPHPPLRIPECLVEHDTDTRACEFEREAATSGRRMQLRAASEGGQQVLDSREFVCPEQVCLPVIGGVLVYRDSHLTATYVASTVPFLEPRLVEVLEGQD